jgi:hypothetical protein
VDYPRRAFSIARCALRVGRFDGDPSGPEVPAFYAAEFDAAVEFWRATGDFGKHDV